ncbi:hypothetical protein M0R04_12470 [Candidatus Dojkabacteria bacterium]|jgi:hypothetical protein|nr:hypothetical protein [Candidatus Dojkabacteria bacterium]
MIDEQTKEYNKAKKVVDIFITTNDNKYNISNLMWLYLEGKKDGLMTAKEIYNGKGGEK